METDKPMDPVTISALIGAGSGLVGGLINNSYQDAKSDEQWARTLYMQDKMNAYNSPKNQMKLLREAGLNPNLVYAHGGAVMQSAGGNAPPPPNSAPLDTQAVLQMVQTVVQGMLEKDKIQANKDLQGQSIQSQERMQDKSIQSQAGMQDKSIQSQERMQDKSIQSQSSMQDKSIQSQERMQDKSIESQERMHFAQMSESARQADMRNAIDRAHVAIDKMKARSDISESSSRTALNRQAYRLHSDLDELTIMLEDGKVREQQLRNGVAEINQYISSGNVDKDVLRKLYDKYDIDYTEEQLDNVQYIADRINRRLRLDASINNNMFMAYMNSLWESVLKPIPSIIGAIK